MPNISLTVCVILTKLGLNMYSGVLYCNAISKCNQSKPSPNPNIMTFDQPVVFIHRHLMSGHACLTTMWFSVKN